MVGRSNSAIFATLLVVTAEPIALRPFSRVQGAQLEGDSGQHRLHCPHVGAAGGIGRSQSICKRWPRLRHIMIDVQFNDADAPRDPIGGDLTGWARQVSSDFKIHN